MGQRSLRAQSRAEDVAHGDYSIGAQVQGPDGPLHWMREKMDSVQGKVEYAKRLATAEPPFANIRWAMGLNRFTLRGKHKVDSQWQLYCMVHNIGKIHRYGYSGTG